MRELRGAYKSVKFTMYIVKLYFYAKNEKLFYFLFTDCHYYIYILYGLMKKIY